MGNEMKEKKAVFDYRKLKGRIVEKFGTQQKFAKALNISNRTMSLRMTGACEWKQLDICKAADLLEIEYEDIPKYFFKRKE